MILKSTQQFTAIRCSWFISLWVPFMAPWLKQQRDVGCVTWHLTPVGIPPRKPWTARPATTKNIHELVMNTGIDTGIDQHSIYNIHWYFYTYYIHIYIYYEYYPYTYHQHLHISIHRNWHGNWPTNIPYHVQVYCKQGVIQYCSTCSNKICAQTWMYPHAMRWAYFTYQQHIQMNPPCISILYHKQS